MARNTFLAGNIIKVSGLIVSSGPRNRNLEDTCQARYLVPRSRLNGSARFLEVPDFIDNQGIMSLKMAQRPIRPTA